MYSTYLSIKAKGDKTRRELFKPQQPQKPLDQSNRSLPRQGWIPIKYLTSCRSASISDWSLGIFAP